MQIIDLNLLKEDDFGHGHAVEGDLVDGHQMEEYQGCVSEKEGDKFD